MMPPKSDLIKLAKMHQGAVVCWTQQYKDQRTKSELDQLPVVGHVLSFSTNVMDEVLVKVQWNKELMYSNSNTCITHLSNIQLLSDFLMF